MHLKWCDPRINGLKGKYQRLGTTDTGPGFFGLFDFMTNQSI